MRLFPDATGRFQTLQFVWHQTALLGIEVMLGMQRKGIRGIQVMCL